MLRTSSSHEEGCIRRWSVLTEKLTGHGDTADTLCGVEVEWAQDGGKWQMKKLPGTEFSMPVDLVLLAMGFSHVHHSGLVEQLELDTDDRGNIRTHGSSMTSRDGVFSAGDCTMGASLVVRAIDAGRRMAAEMDAWLQEELPPAETKMMNGGR